MTRDLIKPTLVTPGGRSRFDLDELKAQMQRRPRERPEQSEDGDE